MCDNLPDNVSLADVNAAAGDGMGDPAECPPDCCPLCWDEGRRNPSFGGGLVSRLCADCLDEAEDAYRDRDTFAKLARAQAAAMQQQRERIAALTAGVQRAWNWLGSQAASSVTNWPKALYLDLEALLTQAAERGEDVCS